MFTGIIESVGIINEVISAGNNLSFWIQSSVSQELKIDQSVSHDGICLTVDELQEGQHRVTAIAETIAKTAIKDWQKGSVINLERCLKMNRRLDGHIVQGHVDTVATCKNITEKNGSWEFEFTYPYKFASLLIEKGSICLNGISLTVFGLYDNYFKIAIIPYTFEHTNMQYMKQGNRVNIEFDMIGKYLNRMAELKS